MSSKTPENVETPEQIAEKLENVDLNAEKSEGEGETSTKQPELSPEQKLAKLKKQINDYVELLKDPDATFDVQLRELIKIPTEAKTHFSKAHQDLYTGLYEKIPVKWMDDMLDATLAGPSDSRWNALRILLLSARCGSKDVKNKYVSLLEKLIRNLSTGDPDLTIDDYEEMADLVSKWAKPGDVKHINTFLNVFTKNWYSQENDEETPRYAEVAYNSLKQLIEIGSIESSRLNQQLWRITMMYTVRRAFPSLKESKNEKFASMIWGIVDLMKEFGGVAWFELDKNFCRQLAAGNLVRLNCAFEKQDADSMENVLELIKMLCEVDKKNGSRVELINDSAEFIILNFVRCYEEKVSLPIDLSLMITEIVLFFMNEKKLKIDEDRVKQNFGAAMLDTGFAILEEASADDLRGDIGPLFMDLIKRLHEFEHLSEPVPVFVIKYLDKIRMIGDYKEWKMHVDMCIKSIDQLKGRSDWYSVQKLQEADALNSQFDNLQKLELKRVFNIFNQLPTAK